jgi:hypothetical protein
MSPFLGRCLGRGWVAALFAVISSFMFLYLVPNAAARVTQERTLAPRILDEYFPTWSPADATTLFEALGPEGRKRYQAFYWKLDFWFPMLSLSILYCALLSLAFPRNSQWARLNLLACLMYCTDVAENLNHFAMAAQFPELAPASLWLGPALSFLKYGFICALPFIALAGFVRRRAMKFLK